jgi:hypothetical protein
MSLHPRSKPEERLNIKVLLAQKLTMLLAFTRLILHKCVSNTLEF